MKTYVTFGQAHEHVVNKKYFNCDCVAVFKCDSKDEGRALAHQYFGNTFFTTYFSLEWQEEKLKYFPRGYIPVRPEDE